jgi:hypothetical protein
MKAERGLQWALVSKVIAYAPAIIVLSLAAGLLAPNSHGRKSWELEIWEAVSGNDRKLTP